MIKEKKVPEQMPFFWDDEKNTINGALYKIIQPISKDNDLIAEGQPAKGSWFRLRNWDNFGLNYLIFDGEVLGAGICTKIEWAQQNSTNR